MPTVLQALNSGFVVYVFHTGNQNQISVLLNSTWDNHYNFL